MDSEFWNIPYLFSRSVWLISHVSCRISPGGVNGRNPETEFWKILSSRTSILHSLDSEPDFETFFEFIYIQKDSKIWYIKNTINVARKRVSQNEVLSKGSLKIFKGTLVTPILIKTEWVSECLTKIDKTKLRFGPFKTFIRLKFYFENSKRSNQ